MAITYQGQKISSPNTNNKKPVKKGSNSNKRTAGIIIGCVASAAAIVGLIILGVHTYKSSKPERFETAEELAARAIEYTYVGSAEGLFNLTPEDMQERSLQDVRITYSFTDDASATRKMDDQLGEFITNMDYLYGQGWTMTQAPVGYYQYTEEEKSALEVLYRMQGVSDDFVCDEAGYVEVEVTITPLGYTDTTVESRYVPVLKIDGSWYLGQYTDDVMLAKIDGQWEPYGELLDGFHIVGEFDHEGTRIYRTEDGHQLFLDKETGERYYEGDYGNRHYVKYEVLDIYGYCSVEDIRVEGPDGGEPLTAETYDAWFNEKYSEQIAEWEAAHEEAHSHEDVPGSEDGTVSGNEIETDGE